MGDLIHRKKGTSQTPLPSFKNCRKTRCLCIGCHRCRTSLYPSSFNPRSNAAISASLLTHTRLVSPRLLSEYHSPKLCPDERANVRKHEAWRSTPLKFIRSK